MIESLKNIKNGAGYYDNFDIDGVVNYLQNYKPTRLCSNAKITSIVNGNLNENEDCKTFICEHIDQIEKKKNLNLNLDNKKTFFEQDTAFLTPTINNQGYAYLNKLDDNIILEILKGLEKINFYGRNTQKHVHNEYIKINQIPSHLNQRNNNIHTYFMNQRNHKDVTDLLNIEALASLIVDPTILKTAKNHLGCLPKLQAINSWITFYTDKNNEQAFAAQDWHTDNDCHKFFKVFLYLNDVDETNGAHEIISNSKKTISQILKSHNLRRGQIILEENKKILSGPSGTIFLEDTRNLHRGGKITNPNKYRILLHWWYGSNNDGTKNLQFLDQKNLTHNILNDYIGIIL
tara:strand:+ start:7101 stop:8141 length:1041 start_codon:yes stop_codon:yes gene_type:complete